MSELIAAYPSEIRGILIAVAFLIICAAIRIWGD